jgi:hypothetical protein
MYLTYDLSLDAAPVVLPLLVDDDRWTIGTLTEDDNYDTDRQIGGETKAFIKENYYSRIEGTNEKLDFREYNYSKYTATRCVKDYPLE